MCSAPLWLLALFVLGLAQAGARYLVYRLGRVPLPRLQIGVGRVTRAYRRVDVRTLPLWPWALPEEPGGSRVARILAIPIGWLAMYLVPASLVFGLTMTARVPVGPVLVREVLPESAAEEAGLEPGDAILRVDDQPVGDDLQLWDALHVGQTARIQIERDGRLLELEAEPRESVGGTVLGVATERAMGDPRVGDALVASSVLPARIIYYTGESIVWLVLPPEHDGFYGSISMGRAMAESVETGPRVLLARVLFLLSAALGLAFVLQLVPVRGFALGDLRHWRTIAS
ncbi:MAG: PDZ domain-containing protein [Sandaracinaceae bacterium]|nr:PDZ domain-containing protein [Sandaracinaceae bacterium]